MTFNDNANIGGGRVSKRGRNAAIGAGGGGLLVVALFVVKKDPNLTEQAVIDHCKKSLTGYKVPKHVYFRTELPKTNVGKILRRALRDELPKN